MQWYFKTPSILTLSDGLSMFSIISIKIEIYISTSYSFLNYLGV